MKKVAEEIFTAAVNIQGLTRNKKHVKKLKEYAISQTRVAMIVSAFIQEKGLSEELEEFAEKIQHDINALAVKNQ